MLLYLGYTQSLAWIQVESFPEEVLKVFITFEGRRVEISVLNLFAETKAFSTFLLKLLPKGRLVFSFKLERILMNE